MPVRDVAPVFDRHGMDLPPGQRKLADILYVHGGSMKPYTLQQVYSGKRPHNGMTTANMGALLDKGVARWDGPPGNRSLVHWRHAKRGDAGVR